jgi:hypothetical protein
MNQKRGCGFADGFSLWEKMYAQGTFFTLMISGTIGIARADWRWLLPFVVVCWYGIPGIVMRHLNCPRCPHLYHYGDCLQFPTKWTRLLVKGRKTTPFTAGERWMFYFIFTFIPIYPLYWLRSQPVLLTIFGVTAVMWYLGQWLYFCKRCRVKACPFNRACAAEPNVPPVDSMSVFR